MITIRSTTIAPDPGDSSNAEAIALQALAFVAQDARLLQRFLDLSGYTPDSLRAGVGSPELSVAVLDFLLGHEPDLLAFCADAGLPPDAPGAARRALAD